MVIIISPRKTNRPTLDEYFGLEAIAYGKSNWMARNQIQTTNRALNLMESNEIGGIFTEPLDFYRFLDLGAGTGYSSHTILETGAKVIGVDFSWDMLSQNPSDVDLCRIHADMRYLPLRENVCDHMISISAFNFAAEGATTEREMEKLIHSVLSNITTILKPEAKIAIEYYPTELQEQKFFHGLKQYPLPGGMIIDNPKTRKEKKYLILQNHKKC